MSTTKFEDDFNNKDQTQQKQILLQWAKAKVQLTIDQLLFALEKVVQYKDVDLNEHYFDYLNKVVFIDNIRTSTFIKSLQFNDAVITFVLSVLSADILKNFKYIMGVREKFPAVLLDSGHCLSSTKKLFTEIDQAVLGHIMAFTFSDELPMADFFLYLYLVFSEQIFDPNKRYMDSLYENKSHHQHLLNFFQYFKKPAVQKKIKNSGFSYDDIKLFYAHFLDSVKYSRENVESASLENELFILMANLFHGDENLPINFFQNIQVVLKNIVNFPDPKKNDELKKHFDRICGLDQHISAAFISYLFNSDSNLGLKLFQNMTQDCKLYGKFSNNIKKIQSKQEEELSKKSEQEEKSSINAPESEQEESQQGSEATKEIRLGYFDADGWEVQLSLLTPSIIHTTSDRAPTELISALDDLAEHAREHLANKNKSHRAKEGLQKYSELENLFSELSNIKTKSVEDALTQARDILRQHLDQEPKESDLLKNRGGFFGAYKTFSKIYSKFGLLHYDYTKTDGTKRTAESTTDHLLIALLDSIDEQLVSLDHSVDNSK